VTGGWPNCQNRDVRSSAAPLDPPPTGSSYVERPPAAALAGFVSSTWVQHIAPGAAPYVHRNIPNGGVELLCRLGSVPQLAGPLTRARVESLAPGSIVVGLRFHPGAATPVLGMPASELVDLMVDANAVWGREVAAVGERMADAASAQRAAALLQQIVADRLADAARPDPVVAEAVRRLMPWQARHVTSLASSLATSERSFRRQCRATIGVGPKALQRMLRFQGFLARVQYAVSQGRRPAADGLALLAADVGYTDQAHLTRECVRLAGVTPRVFLRETAEFCGCGHDHETSYAPLLRRPA
jgi:methylphosphotriester-DNA--protein-cysteine methyltransferase